MKYEFTGETNSRYVRTLHRIRRISDGKLGGWIEKEENLSQEGNCWVDDDAKVYGNAQVYGNATVSGNAEVYENAKVYNNAKVYGDAEIYGNAKVYGDAHVYDRADVCDNANIYDNAEVCGKAEVFGDALVYGNAKVYGNAIVWNNARVYSNAKVYGDADVCGNAEVFGNAKVCGNAKVKYIVSSNETIGDIDDDINELAKDFIYKIDESNKLEVQIEYDSIDEFFNEPITNDVKLDTIIICSVDTKLPLIKLEKSEHNDKLNFKFIIDITLENGEQFLIKTFIENQEQLNTLITQTIESLKNYPQFSKYAEDLENCL